MAFKSNSGWVEVGSIMKSKKGTNYLKVANDVTLKAGQILNIQNPRSRKGISEEQLAKIPDYVLANVSIPPERKD